MSGTTVENTNASTDAPNSYEICMRSGFKVKRGTLIFEKHSGMWVHPDFAEPRPWGDFVRSKPENQRGAVSPEPIGNEIFLANGEVTAADL